MAAKSSGDGGRFAGRGASLELEGGTPPRASASVAESFRSSDFDQKPSCRACARSRAIRPEGCSYDPTDPTSAAWIADPGDEGLTEEEQPPISHSRPSPSRIESSTPSSSGTVIEK
jgi:hypothetical protein